MNNEEITISKIIIVITTFIILSLYILTENYIINNIIAFCITYMIITIYHFNNFKNCIFFLFMMSIYDFFWTYISPFIFTENVMVYAARNINLPIKLLFPIVYKKSPLDTCIILGLGDLIIPGFVLKFLHRFDFIKMRNIYYKCGILLYFLGLCMSGFSFIIFNVAQPVIFFVCPILCGGILIISSCFQETYEILTSDKLETQTLIKKLRDYYNSNNNSKRENQSYDMENIPINIKK